MSQTARAVYPPPGQPVAVTIVRSPAHDLAGHPEAAARFDDLRDPSALCPGGAWLEVQPAPADPAQLVRVHPRRYLESLAGASRSGPAYIDPAPTYVTRGSYEAAVLAAGSTSAVVELVVQGRASSGLAIVRPPGHHASATMPMGFCLLNNIALAARHAQSLGLRRVMIIDVDLHHGNGTQEIFYEDPEVLYISSHQAGIYPGSGDADERGAAEGLGTTINCPLPRGAGDTSMARMADLILEPAADRFRPEIILVSAGFDAHWRDPLGGLQMTAGGVHALTRRVMDLAGRLCSGRLAIVLEGGYDPPALAACLTAAACALHGAPPPADTLGPPPDAEMDCLSLIESVANLHRLSA